MTRYLGCQFQKWSPVAPCAVYSGVKSLLTADSPAWSSFISPWNSHLLLIWHSVLSVLSLEYCPVTPACLLVTNYSALFWRNNAFGRLHLSPIIFSFFLFGKKLMGKADIQSLWTATWKFGNFVLSWLDSPPGSISLLLLFLYIFFVGQKQVMPCFSCHFKESNTPSVVLTNWRAWSWLLTPRIDRRVEVLNMIFKNTQLQREKEH